MSVRRFFGSNNRDAMQRVRAALGEDALVLSHRAGPDGVEILALSEADVAQLEAGAEAGAATGGKGPAPLRGKALAEAWQCLHRQLRGAGFSAAFAEDMLPSLPATPDAPWLHDWLCQHLRTAGPDALAQARVVVLLGPTGAGKTLVAAKLAARHARGHGAEQVALVGTDIYRRGALGQLRGLADELQVDLHTTLEQDLADVLTGLDDKRLIIVDAPGFSPRDARLLGQVQWLCRDVKVLPILVLSAAGQAEALDDAVVRYRAAVQSAGLRLRDAIVTKHDEAPRLGPVLEVLLRHDLRLHALGQGQRLDAPLPPVDGAALVREALAVSARDIHAEAVPLAHQIVRQGRALQRALALLRRHAAGFAAIERAWAGPATAMPEAAPKASAVVPEPAPVAWFWHPEKGFAVHGVDASGQAVAGSFRHLCGGWADQFTDPDGAQTDAVWLLSSLPRTALWRRLCVVGTPWAARVGAGVRVWHGAEQRALSQWQPLATSVDGLHLHWHGRVVQAQLRHLPVGLTLAGGRVSACLVAWFVDLRDLASGAALGQRHFVLPRDVPVAAAQRWIVAHLHNESMPQLVRRAADLLARDAQVHPGPHADALAGALAMLACRVHGNEQVWALELREELGNLTGKRMLAGEKRLLEALVMALGTRAALQSLVAAAPSTWESGR